MNKSVQIYTDGACKGNPGIGGWGAVLIYNDTFKYLNGYESHTTNNRMELLAVIRSLTALKQQCSVVLHTDSKYVQQGMLHWLENWKNNNWRTSNKQSVKNIDLWQQLDNLANKHSINWQWVKAHAGNIHNEKADWLANQAVIELQLQLQNNSN